ncbi:hypothetical protein [Marinobacterium mangrovicola]|uniref:Uncharacterized protein n=1 Tax=Marinobacterium mangrovicola TaxID=1476959 RepID=A0A4R1GJ97_9GAMM|nr:hypothetical protein [Marinobacterium mangrovicola]TCK07203.1 hypothetical protein CLV83_2061 [Marinobacterium mangrovicola]
MSANNTCLNNTWLHIIGLNNICLVLLASLLLGGCSYEAYNGHGSGYVNSHVSSRTTVGVQGYYDSDYDDFFFYPDVNVYLGINSGSYYYRPRPSHRSSWVGVRVLPGYINLRPSHRVRIDRLPRHSPYRHHRDHRLRYRRDHHYRYRQHR